jgi:hypothetical protein
MVLPAPVDPQAEQIPNGSSAVLFDGARTTSRLLRNLSFQVLVVLLGIALACM